MTAERLMLIGGVVAFLFTLFRVRRRRLREKYAVGWLAVATLLLVLGLFPRLIMAFAEESHLAYPSAVLFVSLGAIYLYCFTVSGSLTDAYRRNVRLMQEVAMLERRVRLLEQRQREATPAERGPP